ncbi:MAG TPA: hypothetical protein VN408_28880 [Actinoplanes sp.]|nr:hypothetical protein [Actinoplanes sp.]
MRRLLVVSSAAVCLTGCDAPAEPGPVASAAASPVVSASANGVEALEAAAILDRARESLRKAPSFRFTSTAGARTVDLRISGPDAHGTVVHDGERTEWLLVDGDRYLKAGEPFWTARFGEREGAIGREIVGDRWMLVPPAMDSELIGKDFAVAGLLDATFTPDGAIRKQAAAGSVTLTDAGGTEVSVATTGEPYPVGWTGKDGTGRITEVGVPVPAITAPPEDDVFELITLVEAGMLTEI